jgi:hypothetical protein
MIREWRGAPLSTRVPVPLGVGAVALGDVT